MRWRFESISSAALAAHDHVELRRALCLCSPDVVSAAADSRWAIRLDRVNHVGGRRRSCAITCNVLAYRPPGPGVRPDHDFAYPPTCLPTSIAWWSARIHAESQAIPRNRVLHPKQADLAIPGSRNSFCSRFFVTAAANREDKNTPIVRQPLKTNYGE